MTTLRFTTSWDDGHPLDLRIADMLAEHGFTGTFYVPRRNVEGRPVMTAPQLRTLDAHFEIGGHSIDHVRLVDLPPRERSRQIIDSKRQLEDDLGHPIDGFCYPGGAYDRAVRDAVQAAGYRYARTVANLSLEPPDDRYQLSTTLQMYPHSRGLLARNFVRGGAWRDRARALGLCVTHPSLAARLERLLRLALERGGVFHLWGHSWELDEHGLWSELERFLRLANGLVAREARCTNGAVVEYTS